MRFPTLLGAVLLSTVFVACSTTPAPDSGFISNPARMSPSDADPFQRSWTDGSAQWARLESVYVAPIDTSRVERKSGWDAVTFAGNVEKAAGEIAVDARADYIGAFEETRLKIVDRPDADTLVVEVAFVELVPTKAWLNAFEELTLMMALEKGSIAMETRLRMGPQGRVIAAFADRELGPTDLLNYRDFTWYAWQKFRIKEWARETAQLVDGGFAEPVPGSTRLRLQPW